MENNIIGTILIPWDFSPVADYALEHGFNFAKKTGCKKIVLNHIVKKGTKQDTTLAKLQEIANNVNGKDDISVEALISEGTIFTTIAEVADEINAELVIMGTHGLKGMQKLTGSWALKVIVSSKVPFVVIQDHPKDSELKNIVMPIDFKMESKEKLNWVNYLSKFYKAKFFIIKPNTTDLGFLKRIKANIIFARKFMDKRNVDYEINTASGKHNFAKETIAYAKEIDADMIQILSTKNIGLTDYVLGASEQYIIANTAKIPVMVINPRSDLTKFGSFI
ncbi:MAG: universal stress protein [Bacteroidota bacterium]|nr:universal stress protein [Bacteroidota bacterium]